MRLHSTPICWPYYRISRSADGCLSDESHDWWRNQADADHQDPGFDYAVWSFWHAIPEPETGKQDKHKE